MYGLATDILDVSTKLDEDEVLWSFSETWRSRIKNRFQTHATDEDISTFRGEDTSHAERARPVLTVITREAQNVGVCVWCLY